MKTLGVSALYNFLIGARSSFYLQAGGGHDEVREQLSGDAVPGAPICGSSGALLAGVGLPCRRDAHRDDPRRGRLQPQQKQAATGDPRHPVQLRHQRSA